MSVTFGYTSDFKKQIKRLKKKYPSLENDYNTLLNELTDNPRLGVDLGSGVEKCEWQLPPKGKESLEVQESLLIT